MNNSPTPRTDALTSALYYESCADAAAGMVPGISAHERSPEEAYGVAIDLARQLERENAALREALEFVKRDLEDCDWSCTRCGQDYGMKDTDIYLEVGRALKPHAQGHSQP